MLIGLANILQILLRFKNTICIKIRIPLLFYSGDLKGPRVLSVVRVHKEHVSRCLDLML